VQAVQCSKRQYAKETKEADSRKTPRNHAAQQVQKENNAENSKR